MKKPVGALGWTAEERSRVARAKEWPERKVEARDDPLGLGLTSLPSQEYLRGYLAALKQPRPRGRKSDINKWIATTIECLTESGGRFEDARKLYVDRSP